MANHDLEQRLTELEWTNRRQFNLIVFGFVTCLFTMFLLWFSPSPPVNDSLRKQGNFEDRLKALETRVQTLDDAARQAPPKNPTD